MAEDEDLIPKNPFRKIHDEFTYIETKNHPTLSPEELPRLFEVMQGANLEKPALMRELWGLMAESALENLRTLDGYQTRATVFSFE